MALRAIALLSFFLLSIPICFMRPFYGIVLWIMVAFLNPQWYTWGAATSFPWAESVAIPTLAGFFVFDRGWNRLLSRDLFLIVALWIWFTITTFISVNTDTFAHHAADTWFRWQFVSKVLLMTIVMIALVNSVQRLRSVVLVIAGCFGLLVAKSLPFMILTGGTFRLYGPPNSMIADNNDFGLALVMTLPLFFGLAQTESRRWARRLFGFLFLITIPAIFFTYSRGAVLGLAVVAILMLLHLKRRLALLAVVAVGAVIALLFAPESWQTRMDPTSSEAIDASARSRLNAWTYSWRLASDFPITGGGFETFTPQLFDRYAPNVRDIHGPHSVYFGVLAEHGFVGLLLYLALVVSCFRNISQIKKQALRNEDQTIVDYANMFRLSLVGFLVCGSFLGRAYFDYFFTVVACMVSLKRIYLFEWAGESSASSAKEQVPDYVSSNEIER